MLTRIAVYVWKRKAMVGEQLVQNRNIKSLHISRIGWRGSNETLNGHFLYL